MKSNLAIVVLAALGLLGGACAATGSGALQAQRGASASNLTYAQVNMAHRHDVSARDSYDERGSYASSGARGIPTPQPVREIGFEGAGPVPQPPLPEPRGTYFSHR